MKKPTRWKRAGKPQYDDHDAVLIYDWTGKPKRVKRWLQFKRFLVGARRDA